MITSYLDTLAQALSFDPALARRVRQEVEDHLREAAASQSGGDRQEAERRAVASFGDPYVLAANFATASLAQRSKRLGIAVVFAIAAVFVAMKARLAWYEALRWTISDDMLALSAPVGLIDRYAFWFSVAVGIASWIYVGSLHVPATLVPAYHKKIRRCSLFARAAAGALVVVVISDAVLTAARLLGTEMSAKFLIPAVSMAVELACAGLLVVLIRGAVRLLPARPAA